MTYLRIKLPNIEQVTFDLEICESTIPVEGNALASGDNKVDRDAENAINLSLQAGDIWAWADITVTAHWRGIQGCHNLGGCSYKDEMEFKNDAYFQDMKKCAFEDLIEQIKALAKP